VKNFPKAATGSDVFQFVHMDRLRQTMLLVFCSETYPYAGFEEEQSLSTNKSHVEDRFRQGKAIRGGKRFIIRCEEAISNGIETKSGYRLVSIIADMQASRNA